MLRFIYSLWVMCTFFVVVFLLMIIYLLLFPFEDRFRTSGAYKVNRFFVKIWSFVTGIRFKVDGLEKIQKNKTYVFVGNHSTSVDMPATGYFLQHYYKSLAKSEFKYMPIFGILMRVASIFVDRKNAESRKKSKEIMIQSLNKGISILIFPEGTRNTTGKPLKEFYNGAFQIAIAAHVELLPFVMLNMQQIQPLNQFKFYPGTVEIKILDPINTDLMVERDAELLKNHVYKSMETALLKKWI